MCDEVIGKRLLPMLKTFVNEYVEVMAPIACGLDVLQEEMVAGLGYLLPTLCIILLGIGQHLWVSLSVSLVRALLDGINSRFGTVFDDKKVQQYIPSLNLTGWKIKSRSHW